MGRKLFAGVALLAALLLPYHALGQSAALGLVTPWVASALRTALGFVIAGDVLVLLAVLFGFDREEVR